MYALQYSFKCCEWDLTNCSGQVLDMTLYIHPP